jgi:hypothetical protein
MIEDTHPSRIPKNRSRHYIAATVSLRKCPFPILVGDALAMAVRHHTTTVEGGGAAWMTALRPSWNARKPRGHRAGCRGGRAKPSRLSSD